MQDFIHNLRRKPHHIKKRILYVSTSGITLTIGLLWFFSLGVSINNRIGNSEITTEEVAPASLVKDGGTGIFNAVKNNLKSDSKIDIDTDNKKESITVEPSGGGFLTTIKHQFEALFTPTSDSINPSPEVSAEEKDSENNAEDTSFWSTFKHQIEAIFSKEE